MRGNPRSLEEWLYLKLLNSARFQRFVRRIYNKVNGIKDTPYVHEETASEFLYKPTAGQRFKAFRVIFWDEIKKSFGFPGNKNKPFK
ncbi:hypothetical protein Kpol_1014p38 [Vanderwaltozyma polyspora DSM 70294]|uniref:Uncharacterized protein n=1 Tax=Vanderwaltozyma polyspora (strain ATCC 22028 / DSM 70294 / BCRC 21397 / CBS 2163 / NBRC 10782 / NRRL Y-8283 / UCD 57-17) TaxID=436907 RepID=A7TNG5_VANPO|nr:uncharacterized protein Kpol_1014p38 [Vanderwaltozyma polyspora DSM 70294]EDO16218.1 hypothetical protein Kpol_1014p38 [Vanderwaltozyma polyspora DSM 70294]